MHIRWLVGVLGIGGIEHDRLRNLAVVIAEISLEVILLSAFAFSVGETDVEGS